MCYMRSRMSNLKWSSDGFQEATLSLPKGSSLDSPFPRVPKLENSARICREGPDRKTAVFAGFSSGKLWEPQKKNGITNYGKIMG